MKCERVCLIMRTWVPLVLLLLAMWISFHEFIRRDDLISKSFALILFLIALYLVVISVIDLFKELSSKNNDHSEK